MPPLQVHMLLLSIRWTEVYHTSAAVSALDCESPCQGCAAMSPDPRSEGVDGALRLRRRDLRPRVIVFVPRHRCRVSRETRSVKASQTCVAVNANQRCLRIKSVVNDKIWHWQPARFRRNAAAIHTSTQQDPC